MITKEAIINQIVVGMMHDINQKFAREAAKIWDRGEYTYGIFPVFLKMYVNEAWQKMVIKN